RRCKVCGTGLLSLKTSRNGSAFIGCSNYPECRYTRPLGGGDEGDAALDGKLLGMGAPGGAVFEEDAAEQPVTLHKGPYGFYVQLGEPQEGRKPPRASIPKGMDPAVVTLDRALELLSLPRRIGTHPEDGEPVEAGIGRYGPYVKHGRTYANIKDAEEVFTIGMNRAMEVLAQKAQRGGRGAAATPLRELGEHPDGGSVAVYAGRYGPYVKWEKVNATLPKEIDPEAVTLEQALELVAAKAPKGARRAPRKAAAKKPAKGKAKPAKAAGAAKDRAPAP
ncbi:MAG TPA: topoisomerase C-terminal repeat-containing protein, partial [Amaricoccus sp.]|nr:topoisomerase C-terminal repeat-containing protein [Amaricoccus sp.]